MKLPDLKEFINDWPKSLTFLKTRVLEYFERENIDTSNVWFVDIDIVFPQSLLKKDSVQVVFFGGFPERIFESGNWPSIQYSFWCLSKKVNDVLIQLFKFPEDSIRVIPRYEIQSRSVEERKLDLNSPMQIVYAGRLSAQKNIEMLLAFSSIMQEKLSSDVDILLLGEWDNHIPKNRGRFVIDSYEKRIKEFSDKLTFKKQPQFIHHLNHSEWPLLVGANSLMVNFSTFVCEDYGVAVAQGQSMGMPMLLSNWGGHCDVRGENVSLVNVSDVGESLLSFEGTLLKAEHVVRKFLSKELLCRKVQEKKYTTFKTMSWMNLHIIRMNLIEVYGHEISMLGQDRLSLFASSNSGKKFFTAYSSLFSGGE